MNFYNWISNNYIEVFGAVTGILYVILEIRQNIWLWPVGIITSGVYIWVFFTGKLYADMSLQGYYLLISVLGWYWWLRGSGLRAQSAGQKGKDSPLESLSRDSGRARLSVSRVNLRTAIILSLVFVVLYIIMWIILDRLTDSPVPAWDSFITSLSIIATWMLARKIYEHWFLWIVVNLAAATLFFTRELYPTVLLYIVYCAMSFVGLIEWKKTV
jgi:nicotinamide mononucleotide transporter